MVKTKTLDYEGEIAGQKVNLKLELPALSEDLPVEVIEKFEDDKIIGFVRALLGDEEWTKFKATKPSMRDFGRLADAIGKSYGFESVGESSGSEASSKSTAEPSPPTSKPSTDSDSRQSVNAP